MGRPQGDHTDDHEDHGRATIRARDGVRVHHRRSAALAFYSDALGFDVAYTYGEPPFWGEVRREGAVLNIRHVDASPWVDGVRDGAQLLSAYILVTDAKALFLEYQDAGLDFQARLQRRPWNMNEFTVRDPDGNLILFASPAT